MGLSLFLQTCGRIVSNPGVATVPALFRHVLWHPTRRLHPIPMHIPLTQRSKIHLAHRAEINGCIALAWSQRLYDYHNMSFLLEITRHPDFSPVCFDIGANLGPYSLLLSESPNVTVYAFEPHPSTAASLRRNLELNQRERVHVQTCALSDFSGSIQFTDSAFDPTNRVMCTEESAGQGIEVECITGSDFCEEIDVTPQLLKIDTEGHEVAVLRGFGSLLKKVKIILLEENVSRIEIQEVLPSDTFIGPLYVDHPKRRLTRQKHRHEDALYLNRSAVKELATMGYKLEESSH